MVIKFTVVENILRRDGDARRGDFIPMCLGWLNGNILNAPAQLKDLRLVRRVCQMDGSHLVINARSRVMTKACAHDQAERHFLKIRSPGEIPRGFHADSELPGFRPALHACCFTANSWPVVNTDLRFRQPALTRLAMLPLRVRSMNFRLPRIYDRTVHRFDRGLLIANQLIRPDHHEFCSVIKMVRLIRIDRQILGQLQFET